jgi:hypothetical protein
MSAEEDFQRDVASAVLAVLVPRRFALAGSSAIREHGIIHRRTADIDLFTSSTDVAEFAAAVADTVAVLESAGYGVRLGRRAELFARLEIDGKEYRVEMDLGADWREREPVVLDIGPVLDVRDAVANKISALYGRGEARDYLDVDAIRASGRFDDRTLLADAAERDPGFEGPMFARQLRRIDRIAAPDVAEYGVDADELAAIAARLTAWADEIDRTTET